jgi:hypothetical protein
MHAVEAEAEQMFDLLRCTPSVPAGWLVSPGDGGQARNGYMLPSWSTAPVFRSLRMGELAMAEYVAGIGSRGNGAFRARVEERGRGLPAWQRVAELNRPRARACMHGGRHLPAGARYFCRVASFLA